MNEWQRKDIAELIVAISLAIPKAPNARIRRLLEIAHQRAQRAEQGRSYGERFDMARRASWLFSQANRRVLKAREGV